MEKVNFIPFQPIIGVPVVQIGDRFLPTRKPADVVLWFFRSAYSLAGDLHGLRKAKRKPPF